MVAYYSALPGVPTKTAPEYLPNASGSFQSQQEAANAANEARYQQGLGLWNQIVAAYKPGGSFGQGAMASYQQGKEQSLASEAQNLVSSGLYNSTTTAGMGAKYEQQVGSPFRLNLADTQTQAYTGALQGAANWIYNKNEQAPNANLAASLARGAANRPTGGGGGGGGGYVPQQPSASGPQPGTAPLSTVATTGDIPGTTVSPTAVTPGYYSGTSAPYNQGYAGQVSQEQQGAVLNMLEPASAYTLGGGESAGQDWTNQWDWENWGNPMNPDEGFYKDLTWLYG